MITSSSFGAFGDTAPVGGCPVHPAHKPKPSASVIRLQRALRALSQRVNDPAVSTGADGLVGPHTVKAANRAMSKYAKSGPYATGRLSKAQVVAHAAQLAALVERAPMGDDSLITPDFMKATVSHPAPDNSLLTPAFMQTPAPAPSLAPAPGGPMPYPSPSPWVGRPPGYSPFTQGYIPTGYRPRGPGGLPTDRATLDVKAFIPAQYEHLNIHPGTGMAIIVTGVIVAIMISRKKKEK